jgi:hypothetical protein
MNHGNAYSATSLAVLMLVVTPSLAAAQPTSVLAKVRSHRRGPVDGRYVDAKKHHIYFRPFCRRSRYVTNPHAPCWQ